MLNGASVMNGLSYAVPPICDDDRRGAGADAGPPCAFGLADVRIGGWGGTSSLSRLAGERPLLDDDPDPLACMLAGSRLIDDVPNRAVADEGPAAGDGTLASRRSVLGPGTGAAAGSSISSKSIARPSAQADERVRGTRRPQQKRLRAAVASSASTDSSSADGCRESSDAAPVAARSAGPRAPLSA